MTDDENETNETRAKKFLEDGYLVWRNAISTSQHNFDDIRRRCEGLFYGNFETKVYPDEWHFRHGLTIPTKTKEIVNAWKCDKTIARLVMDERIGEVVAKIMGWPSIRVAQDDVILKPPGGSAVGLHQDATYISQNFHVISQALHSHAPLSVTVWIPLVHVDEGNGTLLFASGSHKWSTINLSPTGSFHSLENFVAKDAFEHLVGQSGYDLSIQAMNLNPGDVSIHHENMWHCSDPNRSTSRPRDVIAVHFLRGDVECSTESPTYIYGRYKLCGETRLREEFFPTIWPPSEFVKAYLLNKSISQL